MTKVKIKQFKNKAKEPVAGLTPEHAIYDKNGVRLDAKLGNINLSEFRKAQDDGIKALREQEKASLELLREYDHETIINNGTINNAADEEDITVKDNVLSFKDRTYTEGVNEMGYVILRKNKSFAEQVTKENTIYLIKYDFILDKDVTIPSNCVLEFEGGSINGENILRLGSTLIKSNSNNIFGCTTITGTNNGQPVMVDWFKGDDVTKIRKAYSFLYLGGCLIFSNRTYNLSERITFSHKRNFTFTSNGKAVIKFSDKDNCGFLFDVIMYNQDDTDVTISNLIFEGAESPHYLVDPENYTYGTGYGIEFSGFRGIIENVIFRNFYIGLSIKGSTSGYFKELYCSDCFYGCLIKTESYYNYNTFSNCRFRENIGAGLLIYRYKGEITENQFNDCLIESNNVYYSNTLTEEQKIEKETFYKITNNYSYGNGIELRGLVITDLFFNNLYIENNISALYTDVTYLNSCIFNNIKNTGYEKIHQSDFIINSDCTNVLFKNLNDTKANVRPTFIFNTNTNITVENSFINVNFKDRDKIKTNVILKSKPIYNSETMFTYCNNGLPYESSMIYDRSITLYYSSSKYFGNVEDGTEIYYDGILIGVSKHKNGNSFKVDVILPASDTPYFSSISKFSVNGYPYINIDAVTYGNPEYGNVFEYAEGAVLHIGNSKGGYINVDGSKFSSIIKRIDNNVLELSNGILTVRCKSGNIRFETNSYIKLNTFQINLAEGEYIVFRYFSNIWHEIARTPSIRSGIFTNKPSTSYVYTGYPYFCTDKSTTEGGTNGIMIYYKSPDVWVDALGRVIS